jgi:type VII secretion protein EccB
VATKKDLQQAQAYSRQRVLTAFTSGIPGGKELEPSNPMRTVIAAIALAVLLVLGSLVFGLLAPGLPQGWQNDKLLLSETTGSRYVSKDSVLHPVLNTTSARLMIPPEDWKIITVDEERIAEVERGEARGIPGAPDELPQTSRLIQNSWSSCIQGDDMLSVLDSSPGVTALDGGASVVEVGDTAYVVTAGHSYAVPADTRDGVLRVLLLGSLTPIQAPAVWLELFANGTPLEIPAIDGAGTALAGYPGLAIGSVVHQSGTDDDDRLIITADGRLTTISPFAYSLYQLAAGDAATTVEVSPADLTGLGNADSPFGPTDWPTDVPNAEDLTDAACALLDTSGTSPAVALAAPDDSERIGEIDGTVRLRASSGALVRAIATDAPNLGQVVLIDSSGTTFAVPDALLDDSDVLARLGYEDVEIPSIPESWLALFPSGPALTIAAAAAAPATSAAPLPEPSATPTPSVDAFPCSEDENEAWSTTEPLTFPTLQQDRVASLATGDDVIVAVVDSGVDADSPHFAGHVLEGANFVDDGSDDRGWEDVNGHGTIVAGIIGAQKIPESGVVGFAPGVQILPVKVYTDTGEDAVDKGWGPTVVRMAAGIEWAAEAGANIINVSMSLDEDDPELAAAMEVADREGALVVASAGNALTDVDAIPGVPRYPAAYPQAVGVTAINAYGVVDADSISGPQVDVSAPGSRVTSVATDGKDCSFDAQTTSSSWATAYASASAALIAEEFFDEGPAVWKYRLEATASRGAPDRRDDLNGWGLIQPYEALVAVLDGTTPGPDNPLAERVEKPRVEAVPLPTEHIVPPIARTQEIAVWIAVVGGTAIALLALLARLRKLGRREPGPDSV